MHFVLILHKRCVSQTNFYVFSYDKTSLNFVQVSDFSLQYSLRKSKKICHLNYAKERE